MFIPSFLIYRPEPDDAEHRGMTASNPMGHGSEEDVSGIFEIFIQ